MRRTIATHGLLLVVSAIWGGHFVALHFLLQELAPPEVMLIRAILASGEFARHCAGGFTPLGEFRLAGFSAPQLVFGLKGSAQRQ